MCRSELVESSPASAPPGIRTRNLRIESQFRAVRLVPSGGAGGDTSSWISDFCCVYVLGEYTVGMSSLGQKSRGRVNLRVDPDQEARLRAAAEANGETLTSFMLAAANERADQVLERAGRIAIGAAAFERFVSALEGRVEPMPTLSRYAQETGPIPAR
jgi:uncharacterized protein (DUF1778 family)